MTDLHTIAARWLALWNGDLPALDSLVATDVVTHAVTVGQVTEKPMIGRDALGGWIAQMQTAMPGLRLSVEVGPLVDGDLIALRWRVQGEHGATRVSFTGTDILRVADERIVEYWVNSDAMLMMAKMQAGAPPSCMAASYDQNGIILRAFPQRKASREAGSLASLCGSSGSCFPETWSQTTLPEIA